ncbi:hypothetical protein H0O02_05025, partial [Candidatus Micrarchaeota archaeon]|nr:hypothetical protein [Candidatus Micrarchaeota archaeon]
MEKATVVKTIVLEELANGDGERAESVLKTLGQLDLLLGADGERYKTAVLELMEATLQGLLKEDNPGRQKLADLGTSLVVLTGRFGYEVYEYLLMPVQLEYRDLSIEEKYEYEKIMPVAVIQAGARIV